MIVFVLAYTVTKHLNKYVVDEIRVINDKLNLTANGKFDGNIEVQSSRELFELSDHINTMRKSILDNNIKMSYVLSKTNLLIGVYEYSDTMGRVEFTEYVPQILSVSPEEMERLSSDTERFKNLIGEICSRPVPDEPNVFAAGEKYVKLDAIKNDADVFGVVMDVTSEIKTRRKLETERNSDLLTGLLNRRGLDAKITELFAEPDTLGYYALVMIDADGLKTVNDTYGHESGDAYLKKIAAAIDGLGGKSSLAARLGGDEFVLLLYGYEREDELKKAIETLESIQSGESARISETVSVPLRFSVGYSLAKGEADYQELLKDADEKMYREKLEHRRQAANEASL